MQTLPNIVNSYMTAQQAGIDLKSIMPPQETIEELAENFNIDVKSKVQNKELLDKAEEMKDKLRALAQQQGITAPEAMPETVP